MGFLRPKKPQVDKTEVMDEMEDLKKKKDTNLFMTIGGLAGQEVGQINQGQTQTLLGN